MGHKATRFSVKVDGNVQRALKQFKKKTPEENKVDMSALPTPPKSTPRLNPSTKKLNYILKK